WHGGMSLPHVSSRLGASFDHLERGGVEIPFEGGVLAGFLRLPPGTVKPPVMVMIPGLDSAKEEIEPYELPFLARGIATLMVDGPGIGEAEYDFPIRGDYEVPVKSIVDWIATQPEVDGENVGLWGVSLGGYYAPRAAAFEKRIKACIALAGPYDFSIGWQQLPELTRELDLPVYAGRNAEGDCRQAAWRPRAGAR
ncbi:alpha/beta hydrolase family protein, partial [Cupriavidus sp. CuC1]|uniref:alpha/beta hydrolase family protein n=1 Tax=Cupriavidus sp. CuC1 TaxID=3373131 RepID=UPI0037CE9AA1